MKFEKISYVCLSTKNECLQNINPVAWMESVIFFVVPSVESTLVLQDCFTSSGTSVQIVTFDTLLHTLLL